jgi:hypothetical protein
MKSECAFLNNAPDIIMLDNKKEIPGKEHCDVRRLGV